MTTELFWSSIDRLLSVLTRVWSRPPLLPQQLEPPTVNAPVIKQHSACHRLPDYQTTTTLINSFAAPESSKAISDNATISVFINQRSHDIHYH